jgi:cytochrome b
MSDAPQGSAPAPLWDLPTRVVHWALVVLILVSWFSGGENMQLHRWSGYGVLGLLVFRLWWGVAGGSTARFASFLKGPRSVAAYARTVFRRTPGEAAGHNPLGAWSVLAMILALAAQVVLGLFASDIDGLESGPLSYLVDFETSRAMAEAHELVFRILQVLVALHILAVLYYWAWKRQNLIGAMITGKRRFTGAPLKAAPVWRLVLGAVLAVGVAWLVAKGFRF